MFWYGPGSGTAAHVKSGWRDPAYEWSALYRTGQPEPVGWLKGQRVEEPMSQTPKASNAVPDVQSRPVRLGCTGCGQRFAFVSHDEAAKILPLHRCKDGKPLPMFDDRLLPPPAINSERIWAVVNGVLDAALEKVLADIGEVVLDPARCQVAQLSWYGEGCHFVQCCLPREHEGEHSFPMKEA